MVTLRAYSLPPLITALLFALLGLYIISKRYGSPENKSYALWCLTTVYWQFCWTVLFSIQNPKTALLLIRIGYTGIIFIPIAFYGFVVSFLKMPAKFARISYGIGMIFAISVWCDSYFIKGMYHYSWGYYPRAGVMHEIYLFFLTVLVLHGVFLLIRAIKVPGLSATRYNQIKWVILATVAYAFAAVDFFVNYGANFYPFGFSFTLISFGLVAYAITKHRLMDITVIIRKTLVYSMVMVPLAVAYLVIVAVFTKLFEGLAGYQTVFTSSVAAVLITFCFQPLRKRVQTFVDSKFFRQYVDREEKLYELSREVITHTTPEAMGEALMHVISDALHPKFGALFLRSRDGRGFMRVADVGNTESPTIMEEDNHLSDYFRDHPQPFVQEMTSDIGQSQSTRTPDDREDAA